MVMLQILREKAKGIVAWFVLTAVAASFVFFGVTSYFSNGGDRRVAAKVNGEKISWAAVETWSKRFSQQYGSQIDKDTLTQQTLNFLIQRQALASGAKNLG